MNMGTKSLLFGAHQFILHPLYLAYSWTFLYGFPLRPQLWVAFFVHDLGYWGKPNMDGYEGTTHPELGADIMGFLFGLEWRLFTLCHSRNYARKLGYVPSRLCVADKLIPCIQPRWLYLFCTRLTGEITEYVDSSLGKLAFHDETSWLEAFCEHMWEYCRINRDLALKEPS